MVKASKINNFPITASFIYDNERVIITENVGYTGNVPNKTEEIIFARMVKDSWIEKKEQERKQKEKKDLTKRTKEEIKLNELLIDLFNSGFGVDGKRKSPKRRITNCTRKCLKGSSNLESRKYYRRIKVPKYVYGEKIR